jgi:hypothetical protein
LTLMAINLMLLTLTKIFLGCLGVWLWLFFKVLFTQKNMSIIFFYFLKIIFEINTSKWFENIKNILLQNKKKIQIFSEALLKSTPKQARSWWWKRHWNNCKWWFGFQQRRSLNGKANHESIIGDTEIARIGWAPSFSFKILFFLIKKTTVVIKQKDEWRRAHLDF